MLHWAVATLGAEQVVCLHFDHALRAESAADAAFVAATCARLGVACHVEVWTAEKPTTNIHAAARKARLRFFISRMAQLGLNHLMLGHTRDDVAETLLERLSRGSGLRGLALLPLSAEVGGLTFLRPLRRCGRAELRDWLTAQGLTWREDASNTNPRYARVRWRRALANLPDLDSRTLLATVDALTDADTLLHKQAADWLGDHGRQVAAGLWQLSITVTQLPDELKLRVFALLSQRLSPLAELPRGPKVVHALTNPPRKGHLTLGGLRFWPYGAHVLAASTAWPEHAFLSPHQPISGNRTTGAALPARDRQRLFRHSAIPTPVRALWPCWVDDNGQLVALLATPALVPPAGVVAVSAVWCPNPVHFLA
jgi:tRNA(Ile)-lysidine synthase